MSKRTTVVTPCSGGNCVAITALGRDWFRLYSTINPNLKIAVTGGEIRAFLRAVKMGAFDELTGLESEHPMLAVMDENAELRVRVQELEAQLDAPSALEGRAAS